MKKQNRKTIEIDRKRIPLRTLLHGKEIRDAAKALESVRTKLNEQEFLYGAKIYVDWRDYGTVDIVARRPETDKEYADRLERARIAEEVKKRREIERKAAAERKAQEQELKRRASAVENLKKLAKDLGLSAKDLVDVLEK